LCRHLYNIIFPYIKTDHSGVTITCGRDHGNSRFELIPSK
jgi:hypothetical protein